MSNATAIPARITVHISPKARVQICRFATPCSVGQLRVYRNVSAASLGRLRRVLAAVLVADGRALRADFAPAGAAAPAREIRYDRITGDFALYLDSQIVGYAATYSHGEAALNAIVYERLRRAA